MEKKRFFSIISGILAGILSTILLAGCGMEPRYILPPFDAEKPETKEPLTDSPAPFSHAVPQKTPDDADPEYAFPDTAPFIDDTGRAMQRDGNCLYSYYNGSLFLFDTQTEEMTLLYRTASTHLLDFCLHKNDIYFVERTGYDSLDGKDTSLWRIGKDGKNLTLLQDDIVNADNIRDWGDNYSIDIYDDILYLLHTVSEYQNGEYVSKTANLYYRINEDGTVSQAEESETLYGALPRRFFPIFDSDFPSFPYAMRNYGYLFLQDAAKTLYRMDPESHTREKLDFHAGDADGFCFSGDQVLLFPYYSYAEESVRLFDLADKTNVAFDDIFTGSISRSAASASGEGYYFCCLLWDAEDSYHENPPQFQVLQILPEGSVNNLISSSKPAFDQYFSEDLYDYYDAEFSDNSCILGDYLYCYDSGEMDRQFLRFPLQGGTAPEELTVFSRFLASSPSFITSQTNYEETEVGGQRLVSFSCRKAFIQEETDTDRLINGILADIYMDFEEYVEEIATGEKEQLEEQPDLYDDFDYASGYDFSLSASCNYMDDDTISFCIDYYQYFAYAAHGYYWSNYYVFDRKTGELLTCEDFVGNSNVFLNTARPYVEQAAGWDFDDEMLLTPSRFSLSEDGYTLYFAPYDIDCYAAGSFLITIPYEAFDITHQL